MKYFVGNFSPEYSGRIKTTGTIYSTQISKPVFSSILYFFKYCTRMYYYLLVVRGSSVTHVLCTKNHVLFQEKSERT